jgi:hypothetical protein
MWHFDFTITLGNLATMFAVVVAVVRIEIVTTRLLMEHEILIRDYCKRNSIEIKDLPTRLNVSGLFGFRRG